ncbi:MAG: phospho-sugar mutase [Oscillospiraceae bacterium]|nr:phospho-sugar mutase [Oscillospiraceae bacterium]
MTPIEIYSLWKKSTTGDEPTLAELMAVADDESEISDRFYRDLSFGTAGLRGILGAGTNRMNSYTVGRATQGLAEYVKTKSEAPRAAIAYDSRNRSDAFARKAAQVFAANGVKAFLFRELTPTPSLSYAVRELKCDTGVVITASHNPAPYNGYKVYGPDGCQIGPEEADAVQSAILSADLFTGVASMDFDEALEKGLIEYIPDDFLARYIDRVMKEALRPGVCRDADLKIVYTPLNGAGNKSVRLALKKLGVTDVIVVPEQEEPNGDFPTCPYPNPETKEALALGLSLCREKGADLLIATDPDCDRLGVALRHRGDYRILTGNEIGVLLLDYICRTRAELGTMPKNPVAVRSVVSTRLSDLVAGGYGVETRSVLTGFKYVGEVIAELEKSGEEARFIFAFEESCGYLSGAYVRDKDAVNSSMLVAEMAAYYKKQGKTLIDILEDIYQKHGIFFSAVDNFMYEGERGMAQMAGIMNRLRDFTPAEIATDPVIRALDYQNGADLISGEKMALPKTNMIEFHLKTGSSVLVRPSGTEPKIKVYYTVTGRDHAAVEEAVASLREDADRFINGQTQP